MLLNKSTLLFIFCGLYVFVCKAQQTDVPAATNEIDLKHIRINLQYIDWQKKQLEGSVAISLVTLKSTDTIRLDAGFLIIQSISSSGAKPLRFRYDGSDKPKGLVIKLDSIHPAHSEITVHIRYRSNYVNQSDPTNLGGSYGKGVRFFEPTKSNPIKRKQLWSNGEPAGNKYWFPCVESLSDLRTTELIATVDSNLTVISNGKLLQITSENATTKTYHYSAAQAYPNYLTALVIGDYETIPQHYHQIPLNTYCYRDEKEAAAASANRLTDMAAFFTEYLDCEYPYPGYSQVMVQDFPFPSLTGQNGMSTISDNFIDDERTHNDFLYLWDGVEAEALASQWFGNLVAAKNWNHIWLTKALSHFLEGKYAANKNGFDEYQLWYQNFDMSATIGDWQAGIRHPLVVEPIKDLNNFLTGDNYLRSRGALVLRMLEQEIGEDNLKKSIRYFVKTNSHKTVTTNDFQKAIEQGVNTKMDWFFDNWIYNMGLPKFEVNKSYNAAKGQLQLTILQTQKPDSSAEYTQVPYFRGKLPLEIDGHVYTVNLQAKEENIFQIALSKAPDFVNVNYGGCWIAEINCNKDLQEQLHQFERSTDVLARLAALHDLAALYNDTATSISNKEKIYKSLLKVAESTAYWRFRINVLQVLNTLSNKPFNKAMRTLLVNLIQHEKSLLKAAAISVLGAENNPDNADLFAAQLNDSSDRVIFNAAVALGKTKKSGAFEQLEILLKKPGWKGQSKMAALSGMRLLGDERAVPIALDLLKDNQSPRWFLGASGWDYPVYAAGTLASFNKGNLGYEIILERLNFALEENDINDVFSNVLLLSILADPRTTAVFEKLKLKYKEQPDAMTALNAYEEQFNSAVKK